MRRIRTGEDAMDHSVYLEEIPQEKDACHWCNSTNVDDCTGECIELPDIPDVLNFNE